MSCASSKIPDEASPVRYYMRKMHGNSEYNLIEQARHLGAVVHISVLLSSIRRKEKKLSSRQEKEKGNLSRRFFVAVQSL